MATPLHRPPQGREGGAVVERLFASTGGPQIWLAPMQITAAASSFRRRYVDFRLPDDPTASRDPLGPVAGRSFGATAAIARAGQTASEPGESPGMA
jgi:hypothetical protein